MAMRTFIGAVISGLAAGKRSRRAIDRLSIEGGRIQTIEPLGQWFSHQLEVLEARQLLSASPLADDIANAVAAADDGGTQLIDWNGEMREARTDQWIIRLKETDANIGKLQRRLRNIFGVGDAALKQIGKSKFSILKASFGQTDAVSRWVANQNGIAYAEPDYILTTTASPNDPEYLNGNQWNLNNTGQFGGTADADIDAPEAWDITTGSSNVVVAVIDSGLNIGHPDIVGNVWTNPGEIAGNNFDDDGNGLIDDVNGWDFFNNDNTVEDIDGHGTHVGGIIGATGDNVLGIAGVNWDVSLMPLKFLDNNGQGSTSDAVAAIDYVAQMKRDYGINIVAANASWGGGGNSVALFDAIGELETEDVLFIAAAGNGGADNIGDDNDATPFYPASYTNSNIITVSATDNNDNLAGFSNFGATSVDLSAPGVAIRSTFLTSTYTTRSGTSMAAPHVSGVAALLKARYPTATAAQIKAAIIAGVDVIPGLAGTSVTGGRLNALGALNAFVPPSEISGKVYSDVNGNGIFDGTDTGVIDRTVYIDSNNNSALDTATQSFNSTDIPKFISNVGTPSVSSTLNVSGLQSAITDVNITLDITHTWDADLTAILEAPSGDSIVLFTEVGGSDDNFTNTTLDDEAATPISSAGAPFNGTFRPQQLLALLDGQDPNGTWTLTINDDSNQDGGSLNSWSLNISSAEPSTTTDINGDYLFSGLPAGSYRLRHDLLIGETQTEPGGDGSYVVSLAVDEQEAGYNFGLSGGGQGLPYFENFDDLTADGFVEITGNNFVNANGKYVTMTDGSQFSVSLIQLNDPLPSQFTYSANMKVGGDSAPWANALLIFDYQSLDNFKFVQLATGPDEWRLGHWVSGQWTIQQAFSTPLDVAVEYDAELEVNNNVVTLTVDSQTILSHTYVNSAADGDVGVGNRNAIARFDDVSITTNGSGGGEEQITENFNDGSADGFTVAKGSWNVVNNRYEGLATDGTEAISLFDPGFPIDSQFNFEATMNIIGGVNLWSNGLIIFDYESPLDYKFVQAAVGGQEWRIGEYNGTFSFLTDTASTISLGTNYDVRLEINGNSVEVFIDDVSLLSRTFTDSLSNGQVGLANRNSFTAFDNVQLTNFGTSPIYEENFDDTVADDFTAVLGTWSIQGTEYRGSDNINDVAVSVLTLPQALNSAYTYEADVRISPLAGQFSNAMIIFDYQAANDFKFVHAGTGAGKMRLGHYDGTFNFLAEGLATFNQNQDYKIRLEINGDQATAFADDIELVSHTYTGQDLSNGQLGLGNRYSTALYDDIRVFT